MRAITHTACAPYTECADARWILPLPAYHNCEGAAVFLDEHDFNVSDPGPDVHCMILRNHSTPRSGRSLAELLCWTYTVERAIRQETVGPTRNHEVRDLSPEL